MAVHIEEPWLDVTPLGPLTIACLGAWLRCGLGGLMLAIGERQAIPMWAELPQIQIRHVSWHERESLHEPPIIPI